MVVKQDVLKGPFQLLVSIFIMLSAWLLHLPTMYIIGVFYYSKKHRRRKFKLHLSNQKTLVTYSGNNDDEFFFIFS